MSEDERNCDLHNAGLQPRHKPTVIGQSSDVSEHKPTVLGTPIAVPNAQINAQTNAHINTPANPQTNHSQYPLVSTLITPTNASYVSTNTNGVHAPTPATHNSAPLDHAKITPSVVPGTIRKGLQVSVDELDMYQPGTPWDIWGIAALQLKNVILATLTDINCTQWGLDALERGSALSARALALTSSSAAKDAAAHLRRLYTLLQELAESLDVGSTTFAFWKKSAWEVFNQHKNELTHLQANLKSLLPALQAVLEELTQLSHESKVLCDHLMAYSLSAQFTADQLTAEHQLYYNLKAQSQNLLHAVAQYQENNSIRTSTIQAISQLLNQTQDSVSITLPAWIERFSTIFTHRDASVDPTTRYGLLQGLQQFISNLK